MTESIIIIIMTESIIVHLGPGRGGCKGLLPPPPPPPAPPLSCRLFHRVNQARKKPELLLSASHELVAVFWPGVHFYTIYPLAHPASRPPPSANTPSRVSVRGPIAEVDSGAAVGMAWLGEAMAGVELDGVGYWIVLTG
jgi:hypothetical protein